MDYPLGAGLTPATTEFVAGLNPYSNGLPSRGQISMNYSHLARVLIPILMDYPLGEITMTNEEKIEIEVLIPILMDYPLGEQESKWLQTAHRRS